MAPENVGTPPVVADPPAPPGGGTPPTPPAVPAPPAPPQPHFADGFTAADLKDSKSVRKYQTPEALAQGYVNLEKLHSKSVAIPGPEAKPEDWVAFHRKMGVPEKPEGYGTAKDMKVIPEGFDWDEVRERNFQNYAHGLGLTPKQYKALLEKYVEGESAIADKAREASGQAMQEAITALQTKWGGNYKRNVALAQRTTVELGDPDFVKLLETDVPGIGRLGNHPAYLAFAARVGDMLLEDALISGGDLTTGKAEAQAELNAMMDPSKMKDPASAYWNKNHPQHAEAVTRSHQLQQIIQGTI